MKVCMINGSPKIKDSCSEYLIDEITKLLESETRVLSCNANDKIFSKELFNEIYNCNSIVFVFPLYVDALPSHLISFLQSFHEYIKQQPVKNISVYAVSNCGFAEGEQNRYALNIIENYCEAAVLNWGFGLGIGTGPFIGQSKSIPWQASIKKPIYQALIALKDGLLLQQHQSENIFVTAKMPRRFYIIGGHMGWRKQAKNNHLKNKDLYAR